MTLDEILDAADEHRASDVFLQEGELPRLKINEEIMLFGEEPLELQQMAGLWRTCGGDPNTDMDKDSGLVSRARTRYRVNLHRILGRLGAVMRRIRTDIPDLETLGAPTHLLQKWATKPYGIILVTGPTGTGKSTTLAGLLQWMNKTMARHIVTIEDPVEYIFSNEGCLFTQREVGRDTNTFARGLRSAIRQAPDVIFVGEIRDHETALIALQASETGHLVLASLHSERVSDTMERFLNLFPPDQLNLGLHLLAHQLIGVVCQKLVPKVDGQLMLLTEYLENGGAVRDWIARRDVDHIHDYMSRGSDPNSTTFLRSILAAYEGGIISEEVAIGATGNETEFRRAARGVSS
ncbi:MAG: Flp pilus assembly complex ATPase component TadA [Verrucomicrobiales bacterium]|jgi:pilus retraction protein PilT|nr:Flp pilus assembly complex ATPase component TadA [Verrucomicrobiales bacterium]MCP5559627.1 Flp pilus assembly complex ATPase component TadA [Verrucomicrobiaceae bacterium]